MGFEPPTPLQPEPKLSRTCLDGGLRFEYVEEDAGSVPPALSTEHTLIISVQPEPIRVVADIDGRVQRFTMHPGDVGLDHAGHMAGWQWLDPAKVVLIHIDPDAFRRFTQTELKVLITGSALDGRVVIHDPDLRSAAERMRDTLLAGDLGTDIVFDALVRLMLVLIVKRYGKHEEDQDNAGAQFGVADYTKLIDFIELRLAKKITPAQMASEVGMSEASFARKFKAKTGQTPMRFVAQMRVEAAARQMTEGNASLGQIAIRCGFSDQAHLSRSFKSVYGCPPTMYRAQNTN